MPERLPDDYSHPRLFNVAPAAMGSVIKAGWEGIDVPDGTNPLGEGVIDIPHETDPSEVVTSEPAAADSQVSDPIGDQLGGMRANVNSGKVNPHSPEYKEERRAERQRAGL